MVQNFKISRFKKFEKQLENKFSNCFYIPPEAACYPPTNTPLRTACWPKPPTAAAIISNISTTITTASRPKSSTAP